MTNPVIEAKARVQAALRGWREARRAVNDPAAIPARLDELIAITERTVATIGQDIVTEVDALLVELSALQFPVDADEALSALEKATLTLDGALGRLSRAASRAGFADSEGDLPLPPGVRVPVQEIASQLEAFVTAVTEVRPVLQRIAEAQTANPGKNPKQGDLVRSMIEKANVKIEIIGVKTGKISLVDVTGLASVAQQLSRLLQSFVATVTDVAGQISSWLSQQAPGWIKPILPTLRAGTARLAEGSAAWIRRQGREPASEAAQPASERGTAPFDLLAVEELIYRGEAPPLEAIPFMTAFRGLGGIDQRGLEMLGHLSALRRLEIPMADIADLAPLKRLTALQSLDLSRTPVSDLAPLKGLTALQSLDLGSTQVSDIAPLEGLTALQSLDLSNTPVSDIAPLKGLTALQSLSLSHTPVSDLAPLKGLTALQLLSLSSTPVSDLAPLKGLTALRSLSLLQTEVSDLAPLKDLPNLEQIYMGKNDRLIATLGLPGRWSGPVSYVIERPEPSSLPKSA